MKRLAVLGHPVAHSRSPAMQTAALEALGLGDRWSYEAIDVAPEEFEERVRAMPGEGFVGANVTIPHKEAALALASPSPAAEAIGAANTLTFAGGKIGADNTDAPGLIAALGDFEPVGKRALVLGAGGSARAVAWALAGQGASVEVWNRTAQRAEDLVGALSVTTSGAEGSLAAVDAERARTGGHDLIVNCTAIGMDGEDPFGQLPIDAGALTDGVIVVDLVYTGGETELIRKAREAGAEAVDGLEVLVRQGAASLRIWTGQVPDLEVMRAAAHA